MNDYIYYFNAVDVWMQSISQQVAVSPYTEPLWLYVVVALCCKLFYLYRDFINDDIMFDDDASLVNLVNFRNQFPGYWAVQMLLFPFLFLLMQALLIPLFSSIYVVLVILLLALLISFFAIRAHRLRRVTDTFKTLQGE